MKKTGIGIKIICACVLHFTVCLRRRLLLLRKPFSTGNSDRSGGRLQPDGAGSGRPGRCVFPSVQERKSDGSSYEESIDGKAIDLS